MFGAPWGKPHGLFVYWNKDCGWIDSILYILLIDQNITALVNWDRNRNEYLAANIKHKIKISTKNTSKFIAGS